MFVKFKNPIYTHAVNWFHTRTHALIMLNAYVFADIIINSMKLNNSIWRRANHFFGLFSLCNNKNQLGMLKYDWKLMKFIGTEKFSWPMIFHKKMVKSPENTMNGPIWFVIFPHHSLESWIFDAHKTKKFTLIWIDMKFL